MTVALISSQQLAMMLTSFYHTALC